MDKRPILDLTGQIDHMKKKGISFNHITEEEALAYLQKNNNYFKLRAFRKNYDKNREDKYVGLDFAYLKDIAIIDMYLRYELLEMCLDIEHFARVYLIRAISEAGEDGYSVVADFDSLNKERVDQIYSRATGSIYCSDLIAHYPRNKMPIWVFVELMQFSDLCVFYRFVAERLSDGKMIKHYYLFQEIRQLRNACAHSNCLLNNLRSVSTPSRSPDRRVMKELSIIKTISRDVRQRKMSNERIRQITTLMYLYIKYVPSDGMIKYHAKQLHRIIFDRFNRHGFEYYQSSSPILTTFEYLQKIVDKWFPIDVL